MKTRLFLLLFGLLDLALLIYVLASQSNLAVLHPAGPLAAQERNLLQFATLLAALIVIPVFIATFIISNSYKAGHKKAYSPSWSPTTVVKLLWWIVPGIVILILAVNTWFATHALDPYKKLASPVEPLIIQVVALRWKWLFIYPEQNIATVNFVQFPENRPITFILTADAPMNSFWIPQLNGQIYAMTGMTTQIHIKADKTGDYAGSAAEISGVGFSGMRFVARASSQTDFDAWVSSVKRSPKRLTDKEYILLSRPSEKHPVTLYANTDPELYTNIVMKYMAPSKKHEHTMSDMEM